MVTRMKRYMNRVRALAVLAAATLIFNSTVPVQAADTKKTATKQTTEQRSSAQENAALKQAAAKNTAGQQESNQSAEDASTTADYSKSTTGGFSTNNEPLDNATVVISNYSIKDTGSVTPGKEFTITFTVLNTSYTQRAGNIYVQCQQDDNLIYPAYGGTNVSYVGYLKQRESRDCEMQLVAEDELDANQILAHMVISFSDDFGTHNKNDTLIQLPVTYNGVLDVTGYDIPTTVTTDTSSRIGLTYKNSGKTAVNNIVLHIEGDKIESQTQQLNSLSGGVTTNTDCYIQFTQSGAQNISLYLTYVDAENTEHQTASQTYSFNVNAQQNNNTAQDSTTGMEELNTAASIAMAALCGVFLLLMLIRERRKKRNGDVL